MNIKNKTTRKIIGLNLFLLLFVLVVGTCFSCFYTISSGEKGILLTFGKASSNALNEGLGVKLPFIQKVVKMETRTQKYEAPASAASKDLQVVTATIATNFHVLPETVPELYINIGENYPERIIQPMEQEVVKATTAKFTAEELITKREVVRLEIKSLLAERLKERGIIVEEVSIVNFDFSSSFNQAIESKVTAEQLKLKADRDLERIKIEAEQKVAQARGEAESIKIVNDELSKSPRIVDYLTIQKWDGKMPLALGSGSLLSISGEESSGIKK